MLGKINERFVITSQELDIFLIFDISIEESINYTNTITNRPVEDGSTITDNIYNNLYSGSIVGLITNSTINVFNRALQTVNSIRSLGVGTGNITSILDRPRDALEVLKTLYYQNKPVDIITGLQVYRNVAITGLSTSRDADTGNALSFSLDFQELRIVKIEVESVEIGLVVKNETKPLTETTELTKDEVENFEKNTGLLKTGRQSGSTSNQGEVNIDFNTFDSSIYNQTNQSLPFGNLN